MKILLICLVLGCLAHADQVNCVPSETTINPPNSKRTFAPSFMAKVYLLCLLLGLTGCAKKPVQAPVPGKVVNPSCVSNLRCDGDWVLKENDQLFCSGKLKANLACIPAK